MKLGFIQTNPVNRDDISGLGLFQLLHDLRLSVELSSSVDVVVSWSRECAGQRGHCWIARTIEIEYVNA